MVVADVAWSFFCANKRKHGAVRVSELRGRYAASVVCETLRLCIATRLAAAAHDGTWPFRRPPSKAFVTRERRERDKGIRKQPHAACAVQTWEEVSAEVTRERTLLSGFGLEVVTASRPALITAPFLARATLQDPRAQIVHAAATNVSHGPTTDGRIRGFGLSDLEGFRVFFAVRVFFAETSEVSFFFENSPDPGNKKTHR